MNQNELNSIRELIKNKKYKLALQKLKKRSSQYDAFSKQIIYSSFIKQILNNLDFAQEVKILFIATSNISFFVKVLTYWMALEGIKMEAYLINRDPMLKFDNILKNELKKFNPNMIWLFTNHRNLYNTIPKGPISWEKFDTNIKNIISKNLKFIKYLKKHFTAHIIENNCDFPDYRIFGNFEGSSTIGTLNAIRYYNLELSKSLESGVLVFDIAYLSSLIGLESWNNKHFWYQSGQAFSCEVLGRVAYFASKVISSIYGNAKKCIVLDLDNTLWGGEIGDVGLNGIEIGDFGDSGKAFSDFQEYLLNLKERGIVLAVCSKNDEHVVMEVFKKHPDMKLKIKDISIFVSNWKDKHENLKVIAKELNLGINSIVFIDDNPLERELVKANLPEVSVPEMPEDPSDFINTIDRYSYFETTAISSEDKTRNSTYIINLSIKEKQKSKIDIYKYLVKLKMTSQFKETDAFHIPRITQLINKTNQFNLTTKKYTENELNNIFLSNKFKVFYLRLKDRYIDYGLVSALIMHRIDSNWLEIDSWVMSCRVFNRTIEEFILNQIITFCKENNIKKLTGIINKTAKNKIIHSLYKKLNFRKIYDRNQQSKWLLEIKRNTPFSDTAIKTHNL